MKRRNNGRYTTTREIYKSVKKYDHTQFDEFCTRVYAEGYKDGAASVPGVDIKEVMERIATVRGIGTGKKNMIRDAIEDLFTEKYGKEEAKG